MGSFVFEIEFWFFRHVSFPWRLPPVGGIKKATETIFFEGKKQSGTVSNRTKERAKGDDYGGKSLFLFCVCYWR